MLGVDTRVARATWTVFIVALCITVAYLIRGTLVVFALAVLFAYLLTPVVAFVRRYTPSKLPPVFALVVVYLALTGLLVASGVTIGSRVADEASSLASKLPELLQNPDWQNHIPLPNWLDRTRTIDFVRKELTERGRDFVPYLQRVGTQVAIGARYLGYAILIPILAFFFLKDGQRILNSGLNQLSKPSHRSVVQSLLSDVDNLLGQYIRALVLQALSAFILYALFLGMTNAPYSVLLAAIAGPLEFIPVLGPLTAGIITALVTGLAGYGALPWFGLFWILLRGFQDYVLIPFLLGAGIELNPLWVLFGVLAGEQIAGVEGMFFSVPVIAILRLVFVHLRRGATRSQFRPEGSS